MTIEDALGASNERLARIGAHYLGLRHRRQERAGGTVKPKLFVHRIHEHGDEWVFTIGTKLAVGPPRVVEVEAPMTLRDLISLSAGPMLDPAACAARDMMRESMFDYLKDSKRPDGMPDFGIKIEAHWPY